jgi:HJR/Mrr/RecB family endonuclease
MKFNDQHNLRRLLRKIDAMDGEEFEIFLEGLYKKKDYKVRRTPYKNDYGADLIITNASGKKVAVQAKRYKGNVGKSAVQEIHAANSIINKISLLSLQTPNIQIPPNNWHNHAMLFYGTGKN